MFIYVLFKLLHISGYLYFIAIINSFYGLHPPYLRLGKVSITFPDLSKTSRHIFTL